METPERTTMNIPAPKIDLWNGHTTALDICAPCWLCAGQPANLGGGNSRRFVYRGPVIKPTDPLYRRILTYPGGAVQTAAETVEDPEMVFDSAELSIYEPSHDLEELSR
jgi:hypothetical protein